MLCLDFSYPVLSKNLMTGCRSHYVTFVICWNRTQVYSNVQSAAYKTCASHAESQVCVYFMCTHREASTTSVLHIQTSRTPLLQHYMLNFPCLKRLIHSLVHSFSACCSGMVLSTSKPLSRATNSRIVGSCSSSSSSLSCEKKSEFVPASQLLNSTKGDPSSEEEDEFFGQGYASKVPALVLYSNKRQFSNNRRGRVA